MNATAVLIAVGATAVWVLAIVRLTGQVRHGAGDVQNRLNWAYVGGLAALLVVSTGAILEVLVAWPPDSVATIMAGAFILPIGLLLGTSPRFRPWGGRVLAHTIVIVGLMLVVGAVYVVTVIGLGRAPEAHERTVLLLSMAAAGVAALLAVPARTRLEEFAERHVDGLGRTPDDALKTFAGRMTPRRADGRIAPPVGGVPPFDDGAHIGGDLDRDGRVVDQSRFRARAARRLGSS